MTCEKFENLIPAYLDGELAKEEAAMVQRHLAECHSCQAMAADLRKSLALFVALDQVQPAPDLPPDFAERIAETAVQTRREKKAWAVRFALLAATIALALGLGYFLRATWPSPQKSAATPELTQTGIRLQGQGTGVEINHDRFILHAEDKEGKSVDLKL